MYIHSLGQPLDYINSVGYSAVQGLQHIHFFTLLNFLNSVGSGVSNYIAINVLGYGRLRRGPSAILPPTFSFVSKILIEKTNGRNKLQTTLVCIQA